MSSNLASLLERPAVRLDGGMFYSVRGDVSGFQLEDCHDQSWFWTAEWQRREREADRALAAGEGELFTSVDDFLASFDQSSHKAGEKLPTFFALALFMADFEGLSLEDKALFRVALRRFVEDLRRIEADEPGARFRSGLRVKPLKGVPDVWEMTWDGNDGRATFGYGPEEKPGMLHVVWRRIGTHAILRNP